MNEPYTWFDMQFWQSGEWQVIQEKLDELDKKKILYCPGYDRLFAALDAVSFGEVKIAIIGQDPYPNIEHATGIAFDVPKTCATVPATLGNIFTEYCSDLHYPYPKTGSLLPWTRQGVLLWNAIPTCLVGSPGSHHSWTEWEWLTKEIIEVLDKKGIVFVFLGRIARDYLNKYLLKQALVDKANASLSTLLDKATPYPEAKSKYIELTHPSPRGQMYKGGNRFLGSRVFTRVNEYLSELGKEKVDWKLE